MRKWCRTYFQGRKIGSKSRVSRTTLLLSSLLRWWVGARKDVPRWFLCQLLRKR